MARWDKIKSRGNVDDRRMSAPAKVGGIGATGILLVLAVGYFSGGEQAMQVMNALQESGQVQVSQNSNSEFAGNDKYEVFASTVLGSNNDVWNEHFEDYRAPKLVLFRQATKSGCGSATSSIGPHYCPRDETIYLDETFFETLTKRFGAKGGDVAEAYVIAHEVGHHIQNISGINGQVRDFQRKNPALKNKLSVRQELQADCFAGIWANSLIGENIFAKGEINEAIDAAEAVGDDRIAEKMGGASHPESWTHGSSADRKKWFNVGYKYGDFDKCDTF